HCGFLHRGRLRHENRNDPTVGGSAAARLPDPEGPGDDDRTVPPLPRSVRLAGRVFGCLPFAGGHMNLSNFGMDSITLAGPLESKLSASKAAGFSQIMLWAKDLAGHPGGLNEAVRLVRASGIRVTGIQVMRDFEGLSGALHEYKLDIAKNMLQVC